MRVPYQLVEDHISHDTVEAFEQIVAAARGGEVIGAGFVLLLKHRRVMTNYCGQVEREPILTRGAVQSLDDQLRALVQRRTNSSTTL